MEAHASSDPYRNTLKISYFEIIREHNITKPMSNAGTFAAPEVLTELKFSKASDVWRQVVLFCLCIQSLTILWANYTFTLFLTNMFAVSSRAIQCHEFIIVLIPVHLMHRKSVEHLGSKEKFCCIINYISYKIN